jgi:threonine dehydratase
MTPNRIVSAPTPEELDDAQRVIRRHLAPTRTLQCHLGGELVTFKDETAQPTGSFKIRGALASLDALCQREESAKVITASAGNHGLGIATASELLGISATIVVPETASRAKVDKLLATSATVIQFGTGFEEAERHALELAGEREATFVSPYNDTHVIAGQATVMRELIEAHPEITHVLVPVGGGGLLAGVVLAAERVGVTVIGVQPAANAAMHAALTGVEFVDGATAADGLAGALEPGSVTLAIARQARVPIVLVSEDAIARAVVLAQRLLGLAIEASAAVGIAAMAEGLIEPSGKVAVLLTGRNVSTAAYVDLLTRGLQTL